MIGDIRKLNIPNTDINNTTNKLENTTKNTIENNIIENQKEDKGIDRKDLIQTQENLSKNYLKALDYDAILPKNLNPKQKQEIINSVEKYSNKYGIDKTLILAIIMKESSFNPKATSKVGAKGLMQLNNNTIKFINQNNKDFKITNPYNIEQNIAGGTYYLKYLMNKFNGDLKMVLAAYNAGPNSKTVKILQKYPNSNDISKVPINKETKAYIKKVLDYYENYSKFYK